jgi:N-acetylneuraminate synthase
MLEVHIVFSRDCFGPDVPASVTTAELKQLVEGVRFIEKALTQPVDKEATALDLAELRRVFGKSVVAARDLPADHYLRETDLTLKKPGTGIPAARLSEVAGRKLKRAVLADALLSEDDLA